MKWSPFTISELKVLLSDQVGWFLDGGHSIDYYLGKQSRDHADIDIGVYSSAAKKILNYLQKEGFDIHIANQDMIPYISSRFEETDYNYWVSNQDGYKLQILVYRLEADIVYFRRNQSIYWPLKDFTLKLDGIDLVNPLIPYAFKVSSSEPQEKDLQDIGALMKMVIWCASENR